MGRSKVGSSYNKRKGGQMIISFEGPTAFLSNFHPEPPIPYLDRVWSTSEHAYQADKSIDPADWDLIAACEKPGEAKRKGRIIKMTDDWENVKNPRKLQSMLNVLRIKFAIPKYEEKLLDTGVDILIEGNWWHDNYFGRCSCDECKKEEQFNWLGRLLMQVREERGILKI